MAHLVTKKEFDEVRDTTYTVISFKKDENSGKFKRVLTYMNVSITKMALHVCGRTNSKLVVLVYEDGVDKIPTNGHSWDLEDYIRKDL